jgi:ribosome-binding protein aMBF1 (putative translation factor)
MDLEQELINALDQIEKHRFTTSLLVITQIGSILKAERAKRGISLAKCAKETGLSTSTIDRLEHGEPCRSIILVDVLNWLISG